MTPERFIELVEEYYGPYPKQRKGVRGVVLQYVRRTYRSGALDELFKRVVMECSGEYRTVPDVAMLESVRRAAVTEPDYYAPALPPPAEDTTPEEQGEVAQMMRRFWDELANRKRADA